MDCGLASWITFSEPRFSSLKTSANERIEANQIFGFVCWFGFGFPGRLDRMRVVVTKNSFAVGFMQGQGVTNTVWQVLDEALLIEVRKLKHLILSILCIGKRWKNTNCLARQLDHAMLEKRTGQPE